MPLLFAVTLTRGPNFDNSRPLEEQQDWPAHADFMDALTAEGFVLLGGPLESTPEVLLIVRAKEAEAIAARLSSDPWHRKDLLRLTRAVPWTLRLGLLG
jgi:uncharacterized protein YciI